MDRPISGYNLYPGYIISGVNAALHITGFNGFWATH